ncbi:hypothetical protein ACFX1X_025771 [Malus domestica]
MKDHYSVGVSVVSECCSPSGSAGASGFDKTGALAAAAPAAVGAASCVAEGSVSTSGKSTASLKDQSVYQVLGPGENNWGLLVRIFLPSLLLNIRNLTRNHLSASLWNFSWLARYSCTESQIHAIDMKH